MTASLARTRARYITRTGRRRASARRRDSEAAMNLIRAFLIVVTCASAAIAVMLVVRRNAPDGSYYHDGDRASGVFGVLATGFSVLLGLVVVLAFTSFDASRAGAETEALTLAQQFETAQFMPPRVRAELSGELVCYGRSIVGQEWPRMQDGTQGDTINTWSVALFRTLKTVHPRTASEQTAYGNWLDQRSDREGARSARIHGAVG